MSSNRNSRPSSKSKNTGFTHEEDSLFGNLFDEEVHAKRAARSAKKSGHDVVAGEGPMFGNLFDEHQGGRSQHGAGGQKRSLSFNLGFSVAGGKGVRLQAKLSFEAQLSGEGAGGKSHFALQDNRDHKAQLHQALGDVGKPDGDRTETHRKGHHEFSYTRHKDGSTTRAFSTSKASNNGVFSFSETQSEGHTTRTIKMEPGKKFSSAKELHQAVQNATKEGHARLNRHQKSLSSQGTDKKAHK